MPSEASSAFDPNSLLNAALSLAILAAATWLCAVATIWARQERLIFRPDARPLGEVPPMLAACRFRSERLTTSDGLELTFWAAEPLPGCATLVVFHGNAGNAADRAPLLAPFAKAGYGVVLAEYRGYAGNPGSPSEAGFLQDARAYLDWVAAAWRETAPILCGESIGSGVAVRMAAERPVRAVVLDAPYTSVADLAAAMYRWLPARMLLRHPFDNLSCLPSVRAPLLVLHGEACGDQAASLSMSARSTGWMENQMGSGLLAALRRIGRAADSRSSSERKGVEDSSPSEVRMHSAKPGLAALVRRGPAAINASLPLT